MTGKQYMSFYLQGIISDLTYNANWSAVCLNYILSPKTPKPTSLEPDKKECVKQRICRAGEADL